MSNTLIYSDQTWSTVLRGLSIAGKGALTILLANELSVSDYGVFGIVVTTVGLVIYFLGFEFYTHTTRYIVGETASIEGYLRNHIAFLSLNYILWLSLIYIVFPLEVVPYEYLSSFYLLLVFEHLSTEIYRLLVVLKMPVSASISFFIRNALWAYVLIVVMLSGISELSLDAVLNAWAIASIVSLLYGCSRLRIRWLDVIVGPLDLRWIKIGATVGAGFLLGSIFMRASGFIDRYLIQYFMGDYQLGIYMLYISVANIASSFFESGIVMHAFPGILEAKKNDETVLYKARLRKFFVQSLYISVILVIGAYIAFVAALAVDLLPNDYGSEIGCLVITLLCVVIKNLTYTPHYGLYVHGLDSKILYSSIAGFVVGLASCIYMIPVYGILGAAIAMLVANLIILSAKSIFYLNRNAKDI